MNYRDDIFAHVYAETYLTHRPTDHAQRRRAARDAYDAAIFACEALKEVEHDVHSEQLVAQREAEEAAAKAGEGQP